MSTLIKQKNYIFQIFLILTVVGLLLPASGLSTDLKNKPKFGIGLELGQWVPSSLKSDADIASLEAVQNKPYLAFFFLKPLKYDFAFRSSAGIWKYFEEDTAANNRCVRIVSFLFDVKYTLLSEVFVQPFVSYGAGMFLGFNGDKGKTLLNVSGKSEMNVGFNVGAGFDFQFIDKISLELEFRYHYVKFKKVVVYTDNFSGPKVNVALLYYF
ncbi:outer membrane beta-barrel protein [candidate division KSB1 bacterium]|nr:outer membrane beta-barrel protein [candidate division KSB1 bacterium]